MICKEMTSVNSDCQRVPDDRFLRILLSCSTGDRAEIEYNNGYYVGQIVRVDAHHIVIAPVGKRPACLSAAMTPENVYGAELPVSAVIGVENRGQRYGRIARTAAL
ncbi:predicted amidohydrolase [Zymobacter palmae]|uniref:Predicted amidohydrolase n=1 Tax=Zymobacter palmae TaxID=33074 RepID=A0A348HD84_9GAMM|nr:predicted amidohydrolase [Zymobacter palmae]